MCWPFLDFLIAEIAEYDKYSYIHVYGIYWNYKLVYRNFIQLYKTYT